MPTGRLRLPARAPLRSPRARPLVVGSALCAVLLAGGAAFMLIGVERPLAQPVVQEATPVTRATGPALLEVQPLAAITAPAARPSEIRWNGDELSIDLAQVPLHQAVGMLARATGTTIQGIEGLSGSAPVRLRWQGREVAQAWRLLLGESAHYFVSCGAGACRLWIAHPVGTSAGGPMPAPVLMDQQPAFPSATETPASTGPENAPS